MVSSNQRGLRPSSRARVILAVLAQHADVEGVACLSYSSIARQTGIGKNSIRGLVDELERAGRVDVLQRGPAGSRYRVVECAPRLRKRTASPALDRRLALVGLLALVALGAIVVTWIYPASFPLPYLLYAVVSIGL